MKKIIVLILCMILTFTLAGCGSTSSNPQGEGNGKEMASKEDQVLYDKAMALIEEGNYIRAIDVLAGIPSYMTVQQKILETQRLLKIEESKFLWGEWLDVSKTGDPTSMLFYDDSYSVEYKEPLMGSRSFRFEVENDIVILSSDGEERSRLSYSVINGVPHLVTEKGPVGYTNYDFVPAEYYEEQKPIIIELTSENWSEYFEIGQYESVGYDRWGDESGRSSGYAFFLKDEYTDRYIADNNSACLWLIIDAVFEYGYTNGGSYEEAYTGKELSASIWDYRQNGVSTSGYSTLTGHVVALINAPDGRFPIQMTINDISRVTAEGSIALRP